jgi:hypothetical protein
MTQHQCFSSAAEQCALISDRNALIALSLLKNDVTNPAAGGGDGGAGDDDADGANSTSAPRFDDNW